MTKVVLADVLHLFHRCVHSCRTQFRLVTASSPPKTRASAVRYVLSSGAPGGTVCSASITITIRAFSRRFYPKRLTSVNTHIDTPTAESTMQGNSQHHPRIHYIKAAFVLKCYGSHHPPQNAKILAFIFMYLFSVLTSLRFEEEVNI